MNPSLKVLVIVLVVPVTVYTLLAMTVGRTRLLELLFGPAPVRSVDFKTLQLRDKPNQYLVCPPGLCTASPHQASPVFDESVESLKQRWFAVMKAEPRVQLADSNPSEQIYTFRARTPVFHFPDDVTVQFIPLDESHSTLAVYSRSHYGYSDLGVNRRRVENWLDKLRSRDPR